MSASTPPPRETRRVTVVAVVVLCLAVAASALAQRGPRDAVIGDTAGSGEVAGPPSPSETASDVGAAAKPDEAPSTDPRPTDDAPDAGTTEGGDVEAAEEPAPDDAPTPEDAAAEPGDPSDLWSRLFSSVSVSQDGEPRELVPGTRLTVSFTQNSNGQSAGWSGGCNAHSATLDVTPTHLENLHDQHGTAIGCDQPRQEQDDFLSEFLHRRPTWELSGDRLTLRSADTVIEFQESE